MAFSPRLCPKREKWLRNQSATGKLGEYNKKETIFKGKEFCIFIIFNGFFTPPAKVQRHQKYWLTNGPSNNRKIIFKSFLVL